MLFVDFETDGLDGPIIDFSMIHEGTELLKSNEFGEMKQFLGEEFVVFWHYFMPSYIEKYFPDLFFKMRGKFICFVDIAFYLIGKIKIDDITFELLRRHHEGNAKQDVLDLYECYIMKKGILDNER